MQHQVGGLFLKNKEKDTNKMQFMCESMNTMIGGGIGCNARGTSTNLAWAPYWSGPSLQVLAYFPDVALMHIIVTLLRSIRLAAALQASSIGFRANITQTCDMPTQGLYVHVKNSMRRVCFYNVLSDQVCGCVCVCLCFAEDHSKAGGSGTV